MDLDVVRGLLYALSCGDALGYACEFSRVSEIRRRFGPGGIVDLPEPAIVSDDSQMTWALAEGLLDAKASNDPEVVMPYIARRFVDWSTSDENSRAPGVTCMSACAALRSGKTWRQSAVKTSAGCGAAMRVCAVGIVYTDRAVLRKIARATAQITHGHPAASAATHAAALAVRLVIEGCPPEELLQELALATAADSLDWAEYLGRIPCALAMTRRGRVTPAEIQTKGSQAWQLGEGWVAHECVASALYCYMVAAERGEDYRAAVRYAANTDGDSDSIAAVCGSLAGAAWGMGADRGVPLDWAARVEKTEYIADLAERLYRAVVR